MEQSHNQVACLIWDAFKAQATEKFKLELEHLRIKDVKVPKSMTHLLQPLDLTNGFRYYLTTCITKALLADPKQNVTTTKVDLKL